MTITSTTLLGGCSAEDDFLYPDDISLDIDQQIARKKSTSGEQIYQSEMEKNKKNSEIPINENECALFAMTALQGLRQTWSENNTATNYYNELKEYAQTPWLQKWRNDIICNAFCWPAF